MHPYRSQSPEGLRRPVAAQSRLTLVLKPTPGKTRPLRAFSPGWLLLLTVLATLSTGVGLWHGATRSQDFQWSGAHLLLHHQDPWALALTHGFDGTFAQSQKPNYLALLYVALAPLGALPLPMARVVWALLNLGFAGSSAVLVARWCGLQARMVAVAVCLLLMATPTRNCLGNGQQSLLVLLLWALAFAVERRSRGQGWAGPLLLGATFAKFTFAPPVFLFVLLRGGWRAALTTLLPVLAGVVLVWLWIQGPHTPHSFARMWVEPLQVAHRGYSEDASDPNLMNVLEQGLSGVGESLRALIEVGAALGLVFAVGVWAFGSRKQGEDSLPWQASVLAVVSFAAFKHHGYDAVVLLFPLCFALRHRDHVEARWILAGLGWIFYAERLAQMAHVRPEVLSLLDFLLLIAMLLWLRDLRGVHGAEARDAGPREVHSSEVEHSPVPLKAASAEA